MASQRSLKANQRASHMSLRASLGALNVSQRGLRAGWLGGTNKQTFYRTLSPIWAATQIGSETETERQKKLDR